MLSISNLVSFFHITSQGYTLHFYMTICVIFQKIFSLSSSTISLYFMDWYLFWNLNGVLWPQIAIVTHWFFPNNISSCLSLAASIYMLPTLEKILDPPWVKRSWTKALICYWYFRSWQRTMKLQPIVQLLLSTKTCLCTFSSKEL